ncbi:thioesterase II family protein [Micromonospora sp. NBC_01412]|uniref:thioesterase II family protein n=1 Tax=Micromonospora sp. NBC_01412 TaxID=2903590 RepID=UPI0032439728
MTRTTLLCFPYAGAGPSVYQPWRRLAPPELEVAPVSLPGREKRFVEEPYRRMEQAVDGLLDEVLELAAGADRVALFGHSMGAVLAYEMTRRLTGTAGVTVAHLFVSGSPDPWSGRDRTAADLPDDEFVARVEEFAGYTHPALEDPDMRELLLPGLRADVELHETYRPASDKRIEVPVTALRGADDALVADAALIGWERVTSAGFAAQRLPGGHMYLADSPAVLLDLVRRELAG